MFESLKSYPFFYAVATLIGMIVGAGIFGIPFAVAKTGVVVGLFYLLILGGAMLLVHWFYGEIILRTDEPHRLVGYAQKYLGGWAKKLATLTVLVEYYGALLAYIILGGNFLYLIFNRWLGGQEFFWSLIFFAAGVIIIFWGIKIVARSELWMSGLMLLVVSVLLIKGCPLVNWQNWLAVDFKNFFLPYGVILFSLAGTTAIPEMRQVLRGQEKKMRTAILLGTTVPVMLYILFALVVVGISGDRTSADAIFGLVPYLGNWVIILGAIFGLLAVITSFLVLGLALERVYQYDYQIKKRYSFLLMAAVPLLAYLAGLKDFIMIISTVGAFAGGLDGFLIVLIYLRAKKSGNRQPEYVLKWGRPLAFFVGFLFVLGIIYHAFYLSQ